MIACGGDGTLHEVINGMMHRKDKKKLPIGVIPNGSLNLYAVNMKCESIEKALEYLTKGDIVKVDTIKVIIDHEKESDVPKEMYDSHLKYSIHSTSFG